MILFFISLILTALSAFFITSVIEKREFIRAFIYFFTVMFAEIVLIFEILSLFTAISETGLIVLNVLFTVISGIIWIKYGKPLLKLNPKSFFIKLSNTLKRDKYLLVLGISFIFMCFVSLFLISIMPVNTRDAMSYHVVRSLFWIGNRNFNHFDITNARVLVFPINSEILYAWILMLTKKQLWFGIFQFIGFWMGLISLYGLMSYINISERKKLWVLFLISSFPLVLAEISSTETDLIIAGLVLASMYLYWNSLKTRSDLPLIISSICYALAIGTKTPAIILIPAVGLWMAVISYHYDKKKFYKPLLRFIGYGFISFILFAAYNYILNYINYGNIAGNPSLLASHVNYYGIKGMFANFVKTLFLFLDFTGFTWGNYFGTHIVAAKTAILSSIGLGTIPDGIYSDVMRMLKADTFYYDESRIGMGILGFLVYLPCWVKSLVTPVYARSKKALIIFNFGLLLLIALLFMSYEIMFMTFNIRFLTCFCFITAPVLVYFYPRKNHVIKSIITFFALFSLIFVSTNLSYRPAAKIFAYFRAGKTISEIRETARCSFFFKTVPENSPKSRPVCHIESAIRSFDKQNKILYFADDNELILYVKMLMFEGYQIDFEQIENLQNIDLTQYNIIITTNDFQNSSNIIYDNMSYFSPQKGADCVYLKSDTGIYDPYIDKVPTNIFCQLSSEFFSANGFKFYSPLILYALKSVHSKDAKKIEYRFYENVNRGIL